MAKLLQQVLLRIALVICCFRIVIGLQCYNSMCIGNPRGCMPGSPSLEDCDMDFYNKNSHHLPSGLIRMLPNMTCLKLTTQDPYLEIKMCGPVKCPTNEEMRGGPVVPASYTCSTCHTDGCNSTSMIEPPKLLSLLLILGALYRLVVGGAVCQC